MKCPLKQVYSFFFFFFQYRSCKLTLDIHILDNDSFSFDGQVVRVINYGKFRFCLGVSLIGVDGVWASVWLEMAASDAFVLVAWVLYWFSREIDRKGERGVNLVFFVLMGQGPFCYTQACGLMGQGVGTGLLSQLDYTIGQLVHKPDIPNAQTRWKVLQ